MGTGVAIFFATLLAYGPALSGSLLWDDAGHVTRADLRSLSGLFRIWSEVGATQQYYPLLHSAFWLEHFLWGDSVLGYHVINVIWHATAAGLFGRLLRQLQVPGAWLAAAIFALHPVCVESVAWISEQKNTLSLVFYLGAALAYLRFTAERRGAKYAVATAWFVAALLTKTVTATLPAALLVVQWWRSGRLTRRDLLPLLPWFALSMISGVVTATFEHNQIGATGADFALTFFERCLVAGRVFWFYLGKLFWPADLIFFYPRWTIDVAAAWQWLFPLAALALLGGLGWTKRRGLLAAVLLFAGSLFPALGFVNVYPFIFSFVADHFQYLPSLAIIAVAAAGLAPLLDRWPRSAAMAGVAILLLVLGGLTWRQSKMYRDVFALYQTTLEKNPAAWMAHNNLAIELTNQGRAAEAIPHYERALALRPHFPEAENNLGHDLTVLGDNARAITHLERAVQLRPSYVEAHNNLGIAFMSVGRTAEGMAEFKRALELKPKDASTHFNLGLALASSGRTAEAVPYFEQAVRLRPDYGDAELNWGIALMLLNRFPEAVPHFERAIELNPESAETQNMFGRALANAGRFNEAIAHYRQALELNPDFGEAHLNLALALRQTGQNEEAEVHGREATRLKR